MKCGRDGLTRRGLRQHIKKAHRMSMDEYNRIVATKKEESCMNPWKPKCQNTDIALDIQYKGRRLPICNSCWENDISPLKGDGRQWSSP